MASVVFLLIIAASLVVALRAKSGHNTKELSEYLVASRHFGSGLFFFLAVGEIYSLGTMLGFPGGIYSKGITYGIWFMGYILLAYPIGYFLNPWIWRAGNLYKAMTLPDLFKGHFNSRPLELTVTITAILFMIPWGQLQFTGLIIAMHALGWKFNPVVLSVLAACLAFAYIATAGIRAPAMVSIIKDILLVVALVITGVAAVSAKGVEHIFTAASSHFANNMTSGQLHFSMTTMLFQALGFYMFPFNIPTIFTAKSGKTIRRSQIIMPLYMLMFPFLVVSAYYALGENLKLPSANQAFMAASIDLLPHWLLGLVAAGAALSGLVVLAGICLSIGPLITRNVFAHLSEPRQRRGAQIVIICYLAFSIVLTIFTPSLMVTLVNTAYFGITQFFPGIFAMMFIKKTNPWAVMAGIICGDVLAITMYLNHVNLANMNIGFICLVINIAIVAIGTSLAPRHNVVPVSQKQAA